MLRSGGVFYIEYNENGCLEQNSTTLASLYLSYICVYTTYACEPLQISKQTYPRQKIQNGLHCSPIICVVVDILEELMVIPTPFPYFQLFERGP